MINHLSSEKGKPAEIIEVSQYVLQGNTVSKQDKGSTNDQMHITSYRFFRALHPPTPISSLLASMVEVLKVRGGKSNVSSLMFQGLPTSLGEEI